MSDIRRYEMLVRVNAFGAAHADLFPGTSPGGKLFAALNTAVSDLETHVVSEAQGNSAARENAAAKGLVRERLRNQAARLLRTAQLATVGTPGHAEKFRLPKSRSDQRLLAAVKAALRDAEPFADSIVAHNLPPTFIADVTAVVEEFEAAIQTHATAKELRSSSRAAIGDRLPAALVMAEQLETVVANQCVDNPALLAEWTIARHVSRVSIPYASRKHLLDSATPAPAPKPEAA